MQPLKRLYGNIFRNSTLYYRRFLSNNPTSNTCIDSHAAALKEKIDSIAKEIVSLNLIEISILNEKLKVFSSFYVLFDLF